MKRASAIGVAVAATLAAFAAATAGAATYRYELTEAVGTTAETAPFRELDLGNRASGQASLSFSIVNRPRATVSPSRRQAVLPLRLAGSGVWSQEYEFYNRYTAEVYRGTCGQPFTLPPGSLRGARARLALVPRRQRGRMRVSFDIPLLTILPYECDASIRTVPIRRTYPLALFRRKRFSVTLAGTATSSSVTRTWRVKLSFRRL